ncbi:hypothetical protein LOTGIDRAFT_236341 [Lottia gigantea]|uniref:Type-1 angiotensin II receptor-associated protein n=1 Tax=Lottia gigantea TaxID=225164 RepID=V4B762_LOTGI|nr:hypothetical protein LOTGIDRAFT_236341 [Lottia gigantea]ESO84389.1 hypothetical protein LOTGIDRAFT_236341 [Lottia gigantea]
MSPPNLMLKIIVFVHFMLSMWAAQSPAFLPVSYVYMNIFILSFGIIAIFYTESSDAVLLFIVSLLISVIQDIIFLGIYEPRGQDLVRNSSTGILSEFRFSLGMCILNLIIKPVTIFLLYRILLSRTRDYDNFIPGIPNVPGFGSGQSSGHQGPYESIDNPSPYRGPVDSPPDYQASEKSASATSP